MPPPVRPQHHDVLLLDGATGTELDRRGVDIGLPLWSARAIIDAPAVLEDVHLAYLEAGADAITTNTFRTHERSLAKADIGHRAEALTHEGVAIALAARDAVNTDALVLGSLAPLEDCYRPDLAPGADACGREHTQHVRHLVEAGVDLVLLETMGSAHEALAAVDATKAHAPDAWAICFCLASSGPPGVLLDGTPVAELVPRLEGARFVGINCVAATVLAEQVTHLRSLVADDVAVAAYGNVGHADEQGAWISTDAVEPDRFATHAMQWIDEGATIIGGCCGTTPETISVIHQRLQTRAHEPSG